MIKRQLHLKVPQHCFLQSMQPNKARQFFQVLQNQKVLDKKLKPDSSIYLHLEKHLVFMFIGEEGKL